MLVSSEINKQFGMSRALYLIQFRRTFIWQKILRMPRHVILGTVCCLYVYFFIMVLFIPPGRLSITCTTYDKKLLYVSII